MVNKLSCALMAALSISISHPVWADDTVVQSKTAFQAPSAERAQSAIQEMEALFGGAWAKRILENKSEPVTKALTEAETHRNSAKQALEKNDFAAAIDAAEKAKQGFLTAASKATPQKSIAERQELDYKQDLTAIQTLIDAYKQSANDKVTGQAADTLSKTNEIVNQAKELASNKKFKEASDTLQKAEIVLKTAITTLMQGSTVTAIKDESPKGVYEYEIFRNDTYKALIEMLIEKKVGGTNDAVFNDNIKLAQKIRAEADPIGKKGEFEAASAKLLESTAAYKKAADHTGIQIPD